MAYLTLAGSDDKSCFKLMGTQSETSSVIRLISSNESLLSSGGDFDTCSFYSGPSDAAILAFNEQSETCGSIAFLGGETCGTIAYSGGGESCGSIASASVSSCSSFSGGCSYSC